jgi:glutamine amidotransferase
MKTVIIDYGSGNVQSVLNSLLSLQLGHEIVVSNKKEELRAANYLILPGVSSFSDCMEGLRSHDGLVEELRKQVMIETKPFLGICVGMQVLASIGYENGEHQGLCFIDGKVVKIEAECKESEGQNLKIPQCFCLKKFRWNKW